MRPVVGAARILGFVGFLGISVGSSSLAADAPVAGSAEGWLEVARERTTFRYAWVLGEAGDGASGDLTVIVSDRPLPESAFAGRVERDALARADEARSLEARIPEAGGEVEVWLHHPRLPAGVSLRGLARIAVESASTERFEGRLVLDDPGTAFEVFFSAPIERREASDEERAAEPRRPVSLLDAIREGDDEALEEALAAGPALDEPLAGGATALGHAAEAGNVAAARRLIEAGAAPDARAGRSAFSPLMTAAGLEDPTILRMLLAAGANPRLRTSSGSTALSHAIWSGRAENARLLVAAGADVARDRELLLRLARERGGAEVLAVLEAALAPEPKGAPK